MDLMVFSVIFKVWDIFNNQILMDTFPELIIFIH